MPSSFTPAISPAIDPTGVEERISRLIKRSLKQDSKLSALKLAMSMIDLTSLNGNDSEGKILQLCSKALHPYNGMAGIPEVAAVCVFPNMIRAAKKYVQHSAIKVAAVSTSFPGGMTNQKIKIEETKWAVNEGADEIDMVISRGKFLQGEYRYVADEIAAVKDVCGKIQLKVILETGELGTLDNVRKASDIAMQAGADFIKTSTGKIQPAATLPVTLVMLEAIRDYYYATGKKIGMKPAGGIATTKSALQYLVVLNETLGKDWMNPRLFRFGASSLANDILMQLVKEETGVYQGIDHFSID
jgi:deoxyribose-phosphate aldolase